jgi:intracellular sulfur oxidation DsrE/DsrF family protein
MKRRAFIKIAGTGLVALLATIAVPGHAWADPTIKVVYDVSEGLEQASRAIANARNEMIAEPNTKIVVVTHGEGIKFLLDGAVDNRGRSFAAMVAALASQGVEFRICNNTLTAFKVPTTSVISDAKIVPSGVAEVARLQAREGYAYLHP